MLRKLLVACSGLIIAYGSIGLAFHLRWQGELSACRQKRIAQGEFVEPEPFGAGMALLFNVINWPIYAWANDYHYGNHFATPCDHQPVFNTSGDHAAVRYVVENFGRRIRNVDLQSPNVAESILAQYGEWVSRELLAAWTSDLSRAPGRIVSSPWPDHMEVAGLAQDGSDRYIVDGFLVEVTSVELVGGHAAAKLPVRLVVEKRDGRWVITKYREER